jgi:uncharacterized membrane protein (GlpM family)
MLPTYLNCLFSFWVLGPNAAYVSGLFVFVLGPVPKCCLRIWIVCFRSGSCAQMLPTYLDCLFSFWVLCPNVAYVSGLFVFVLGPGPKCCPRIWSVCFRSGSCAQMLPTYLNCLFSFWVLCPNAAYVSGLFVFDVGSIWAQDPERKQSRQSTTQKTKKMSNSDPIKKPGMYPVTAMTFGEKYHSYIV